MWRTRVAALPPLMVIALGALLGDAIGGVAPMPYGAASIGCTFVFATALLCAGGAARHLGLTVIAAFYAALAADRVYHPQLPAEHLAHHAPVRGVELEGTLRDEPVRHGARGSLTLSVDRLLRAGTWRAVSGNLRVSVRHLEHAWHRGERVRLRSSLRRPRNFATPGEYDYVGHLARRAVYVTGYIDSDRNIELLDSSSAQVSILQRWRDHVGALIERNVEGRAAGVLQALIIGREDGIDMALRQAFSRLGVSHVLSISGLHVGLVSSTAYALVRWLLARSEWLLLHFNVPKCAVGISILPVLLYAGIAGSNVATTRSVLMILVFLGAVVVDRRRDLMISLASAAIAIIAASPGSSLEISFQLSFVAVWALGLGTQRFWAWWPNFAERRLLRLRKDWRARLWRPLLLYAVVSASALLASTPLTALHFNQVVPIAPLANALIVPPLGSLAVMLGLLAAFFQPFAEPLAIVFVYGAGGSVRLGLWLVDVLQMIPGGSLRVVTPTPFEMALCFAAIAAALSLSGRPLWLALGVVAAATVVDVASWSLQRHSGDLRVTFLSIGQGDAAVVELPNGKVLVVDGGGIGDGFDVGERVLARFLWARHISRVDAIVISHPQFDHYDGLRFVTENFQPREVWSNGAVSDAAHFKQLVSAWQAAGTRPVRLASGDAWQDGEVAMRVFSPPANSADRNPNNGSLVVQLRYREVRLLFTGDVEAPAEERILSLFPAADLRSDVLKVAHHGSRTSSTPEFVRTVAPRAAIMSLGADNRFAFPDAAVARRFLQGGSTLLRTDRDGAVEVRVDSTGDIHIASAQRGAVATLAAQLARLTSVVR